jgi:hypothetical protein
LNTISGEFLMAAASGDKRSAYTRTVVPENIEKHSGMKRKAEDYRSKEVMFAS